MSRLVRRGFRKVSRIPHETREIQVKEKVIMEKDGKKLNLN